MKATRTIGLARVCQATLDEVRCPAIIGLVGLAMLALSSVIPCHAETGVIGTVWDDRNANGLRDAAEPGISNHIIRLLRADLEVARTGTDFNGNFSFSVGAGSNYSLALTSNSDNVFVSPRGVNGANDSDIDPGTKRTQPFTIGAAHPIRRDIGVVVEPQRVVFRALDYFPLPPGAEWVYRSNLGGTKRFVVTGAMLNVNGVNTTVISEDTGEEEYYTNDGFGLRVHGLLISDLDLSSGTQGVGPSNNNTGASATFSPPLLLLPALFGNGTRSNSSGAVTLSDGSTTIQGTYVSSATVSGVATTPTIYGPLQTWSLRWDFAITLAGFPTESTSSEVVPVVRAVR